MPVDEPRGTRSLEALEAEVASLRAEVDRLRAAQLDHDGAELSAPYRGPGAMGLERAATLSDYPNRI